MGLTESDAVPGHARGLHQDQRYRHMLRTPAPRKRDSHFTLVTAVESGGRCGFAATSVLTTACSSLIFVCVH